MSDIDWALWIVVATMLVSHFIVFLCGRAWERETAHRLEKTIRVEQKERVKRQIPEQGTPEWDQLVREFRRYYQMSAEAFGDLIGED